MNRARRGFCPTVRSVSILVLLVLLSLRLFAAIVLGVFGI